MYNWDRPWTDTPPPRLWPLRSVKTFPHFLTSIKISRIPARKHCRRLLGAEFKHHVAKNLFAISCQYPHETERHKWPEGLFLCWATCLVWMNHSFSQLHEHLDSAVPWYTRPFRKPIYLLMTSSQKTLGASFSIWSCNEKETSSGTHYEITSLGIMMQTRMQV